MSRVFPVIAPCAFGLALRSAYAAPPAPAPPAPALPTEAGQPAAPPVLIAALPARFELVAWLPVDKAPGKIDLDLRAEVVLPRGCGDKLLGLLEHKDAADRYDVILERSATGECTKAPVRVAARQTVRMNVPDGQTRELTIGERTLRVQRKGNEVTVDGQRPQGDVPGAPPTARPAPLVAGEVSAAKVLSTRRVSGSPWVVASQLEVTARWPSCASTPVGMLGRGDASTHFAITRFDVLARVPADQPCKGSALRTTTVPASVRIATASAELPITVGNLKVTLQPGTLPPSKAVTPPAPAHQD